MTLYEYNALHETEKYNTLWDEGVSIADRRKKGFRIILYQLYSFYVEAYYDVINNDIECIKIFSSTKFLAPYLKRIKINALKPNNDT